MSKPITTLCYIEQDGKYLMLHRTKKKQDINSGKWNRGRWPCRKNDCRLRLYGHDSNDARSGFLKCSGSKCRGILGAGLNFTHVSILRYKKQ